MYGGARLDSLLNGGSSVFWFVVLFLPGFISRKVYSLMVATERPDFSKDFFETVAFGVLNFAVFLPFLLVFNHYALLTNLWVLFPTAWIVLVVAPVFWAWLVVKVSREGWWIFPVMSLEPKAWDYFFSRGRPVWVVATLHDGTKVGGFYASDSYASAFPNEEQLYLQQQWLLDGDDAFLEPVDQTDGVIVNARDVKTFEFYEYVAEGG